MMEVGWGDKMTNVVHEEQDDFPYLIDKFLKMTEHLKSLSEDFIKLADIVEKLEQAQRITRGLLKEHGLYETVKDTKNGHV